MALALRIRVLHGLLSSFILSTLGPSSSAVTRPASSFAPNQRDKYWFSRNENFTFGFKEVDPGQYMLSIWFSKGFNGTAIWWAQFGQSPIVDAGATLNFTHSGNLELLNSAADVVWSSNTSNVGVSSAELLDTGNLVLTNDNQSNNIHWQSFQDLTDTLLLPSEGKPAGPSLKSRGNLLWSRQSNTSYAPGMYRIITDDSENLYLHGVDKEGNDLIYFYGQFSDNANFVIQQSSGILFDNNNHSQEGSVRRLTLGYDGNLRVYSWGQNSSSWQVEWQALTDLCKINSPCGPFGLCRMDASNGSTNCSCPPSYHASNKTDISQGCAADIPFNFSLCGDPNYNYVEATMVEIADYDYSFDDFPDSPPNVYENECKEYCRTNCSCMAASYRKADKVCFLKGNSVRGYLSLGHYTTSNDLYVKVVNGVYNSTGAGVTKGAGGRSGVGIGVRVGVTAGVVVVLAAGFLGGWWWYGKRRKWGGNGVWEEEEEAAEGEVSGGGAVRFTYEELVEATGNFSELLGEGGFGKVYKGWVAAREGGGGGSGEEVAVKLLKGGRAAEEGRQIRAEVGTLGRIHHINLVKLVGFCAEGGRRLLVYEYMANGSLDRFLPAEAETTTPSATSLLPWRTRLNIALGTARGLSYLHHDCHQCILHCDIKPQNVLLDDDFCPKVADFGFARLFHHRDDHLTMSAVRGTRGYMAPEWLGRDEITTKADVFSFGVLLLELVRGNTITDRSRLCDWAFHKISGEPVNVATQSDSQTLLLPEAQEQLQVLKVGLWCIQQSSSLRPSMPRVVQMLEMTIHVEEPPYPVLEPVSFQSSTSAFSITSDPSFNVVSGR